MAGPCQWSDRAVPALEVVDRGLVKVSSLGAAGGLWKGQCQTGEPQRQDWPFPCLGGAPRQAKGTNRDEGLKRQVQTSSGQRLDRPGQRNSLGSSRDDSWSTCLGAGPRSRWNLDSCKEQGWRRECSAEVRTRIPSVHRQLLFAKFRTGDTWMDGSCRDLMGAEILWGSQASQRPWPLS